LCWCFGFSARSLYAHPRKCTIAEERFKLM
jgi:hypothetical protein